MDMDVASESAPSQTTEIQSESSEKVSTHETAQGAEPAQVSSDNSKSTAEAGTAVNQLSENGTIGKLASGLFAEEERLWGIVKANSLDFDAWTALIEETEKLAGDRVWKIRKVYDEFLAEFPLCYGYWKKYADHEARIGSMNKVLEVYERAVVGVTYSVDIWLHFCTFYTTIYRDPETIRRHFERALAYVGTDYLSYPLWDKYIEYEEIQGDWRHVAMLYTRILEIPNRRLDDYLLRFKALAASRPLSDLKTPEETIPPQNESGEPNAVPSETEQFEQYISIREEIYKKTKEFDSNICDFENSIRRPYFHVRPLNISELENWHSYLNFIEQTGDLNKAVRLYERCLIACANYNDYWIRYVLFMEASGNPDIANNALARATNLFVKRQPEIHLFAARFREKNGDVPGARSAYQLVHTQLAPGFLDAIIKHANMEHRVGNSVEALSLYEQAIANEKAKENSQILPLLYSQYARFLLLVCRNTEKAMTLFSEAIERFHVSKPILQTLMHFESIQPLHKRTEYVDSLVEKFISPSTENAHVPVPEREEISYVFMEFLDMFGDSQSIAKAEDRHNRFFLPHKTVTAVRKRHQEDSLAFMGAYPNAQQWPAGYAQQGAYSGYVTQGTSPGSETAYGGYAQPVSGQPPAAVQPPYYGGYY